MEVKTTLIPKSRARTAYGLLSEIRALILAEPKRYFQGRFIARQNGKGDADTKAPNGFPACGTVGCVAGWVATLTRGERFSYGDTEAIACDVLGLDRFTGQTRELFSASALDWDASGNIRRVLSPQTKRYAMFGAAHIRKFQKKYRAQLLAKKV